MSAEGPAGLSVFHSSPLLSGMLNMCPHSSSPKDPGSLFSAAPETRPKCKWDTEPHIPKKGDEEKKQQNKKFELLHEYFIVLVRPKQCKHQ